MKQPAELRDVAHKRATEIAIRSARIVYSYMRSAQIMSRYDIGSAESDYTYRDYLKLIARVNNARSKLLSMKKCLSAWQTRQSQGKSDYITQIDDILRGLGER